jgi:hypothetical protein
MGGSSMVGEIEKCERAEAIRTIVGTLCRLDLPPQSFMPVVRQAIFYIWEGGEQQKYAEDRAHSKAARELRSTATKAFRNGSYPICYDHAVPLAMVVKELRNAVDSSERTRSILEQLVCGVIILKYEDQALTSSGLQKTTPLGTLDPGDLMARYRKAKIAFLPDDEERLRRRL